MALDALAEIVARVVAYVVLKVIIVKIFYWPGWLFLRVFTLGHYPPAYDQAHQREFVGMLGVAIVLVAVLTNIPGGSL